MQRWEADGAGENHCGKLGWGQEPNQALRSPIQDAEGSGELARVRAGRYHGFRQVGLWVQRRHWR